MSDAPYRKVAAGTWGNRKFRKLSAAPPNGQTLWWHLLTGPHTCNLPGLSECGEAGMAEQLGWPVEGFREAFGEVLSQGMAKADWEARVVLVPKAIHHNLPESPNVVTSWRKPFLLIPDSPLKDEWLAGVLRCLVEVRGASSGFVKTFLKAFPEASAKALREASPKTCPNQEQEQEQEQEQDLSERARAREAAAGGDQADPEAHDAEVLEAEPVDDGWPGPGGRRRAPQSAPPRGSADQGPAVEAAQLLAAAVLEIDPQADHLPATIDPWAIALQRLHGDGARPWDEIREAIRWFPTEPFWRSRVTTADEFARHYRKIRLQMREGPGSGRGGGESVSDHNARILREHAELHGLDRAAGGDWL